jgi:V/A-type H+-transporting ATPase subunit I
MYSTERTFLLEAYVPEGEEKVVAEALDGASGAVYYEFGYPAEDENPPTLMKNKPMLSNFEAITNMYSPPNSREFDPTAVMAAFYSIFLGFIMADIGYGLLMFLGGGAIYLKTKRDSGIKRLSGVFAVGGVFAVIWGILFNSLFGISLSFMPTLMPNPQKDMWSLAGIQVPSVLVISLLIGNVQLFAGYVCRAVQCIRRGEIVDGLCDGVTWAVFSVGVFLAIIGFIKEANMSALATVGGILAAVGLVAAMLTAGRKEKIVGKFTKGFGAAYGVINYASDILSYARLYGLMLSGAVIAQIVSQYGVQFITGGNVAFIIIGILLMLVGHAFNLAMSLLGAYIHDARLQYVEFYGRFFEGEGELFTPLGSNHKYIYLH